MTRSISTLATVLFYIILVLSLLFVSAGGRLVTVNLLNTLPLYLALPPCYTTARRTTAAFVVAISVEKGDFCHNAGIPRAGR
jgi:hypothetical protein